MRNRVFGALMLGILYLGLGVARGESSNTSPNLPPRLKDLYNHAGTMSHPDKDVQSFNTNVLALTATNAVQNSAIQNSHTPINGLGGLVVLARERSPQANAGPSSSQPMRNPAAAADSLSLPPLISEIILIAVLIGGMTILFRKMEMDP